LKNLSFYSNGKFLISGEYLVLKGARALAVPLKFGQTLNVAQTKEFDGQLRWIALVNDEFWFEAIFDLESLEIIETSDLVKAEYLKAILKQAHLLNPKNLRTTKSLIVKTNANFDINWGLGSSSTLIANVAKWFQVNPFDLHFSTSSGSGYDVACSNTESPIFYKLNNRNPEIEKANFNPDFKQYIYFVYLGKKQQSHQSIKDFSGKLEGRETEIERISEISTELTSTHDLEEFEFFIDEHEKIMSGLLETPGIKQTTFPDFQGAVKSLGAWGGDFVMVTWRGDLGELKKYLGEKGLNVVFPFDEIINIYLHTKPSL